MKPIRLAVVVLKTTLLSTAIGIADMIRVYNQFCKNSDQSPFEVTFVTVDGQKDGYCVPSVPIESCNVYEVVIIPPLLVDVEEYFDMPSLSFWLMRQYDQGALLSSACVGAFFLARTGLLSGKSATTHWFYEARFKTLFPDILLKSEKIVVDEGNIITAGGISAYVDLVLVIIERFHTRTNALHCANIFLVDSGRETQNCYREFPKTVMIEDKSIKEAIVWIDEHYQSMLSIRELAQRSKMHERTFLRHFIQSMGITPILYLQRLRVEKAKLLLINTIKSFDEITSEVGFENESSFRRLFKRETLLNPGEYRKKFQMNR